MEIEHNKDSPHCSRLLRRIAGFLQDREKATWLASVAGPLVRAVDPLVGERVRPPTSQGVAAIEIWFVHVAYEGPKGV